MVGLLKQLEKSVEKHDDKLKQQSVKPMGTLIYGSGPQRQENKTWIPLKESIIEKTTNKQNNSKEREYSIPENRFPKLNDAIQREKVSIGKALDGSRFKKLQKMNKSPQILGLKEKEE